MKLTQKQIDFIYENKNMVFATASADGQPRAIMVEPSIVEADRIYLCDMQMVVSQNNVLKNPKVFIACYDQEYNVCLKITGIAKEYITSGDLFQKVDKIEKEKGTIFTLRGVIVINITDVVELIDKD
ncbi:MAG: pyridoxamine 5'-phosphate oxidase family protein [Rickettsiales bacterium]|jgi:uncharacterized pyridoxamine 5'-phosphate oxidase family protein|nr:pyridoxamine 5'-phosphate oxidase family protein [Rickettsiales bacterium]